MTGHNGEQVGLSHWRDQAPCIGLTHFALRLYASFGSGEIWKSLKFTWWNHHSLYIAGGQTVVVSSPTNTLMENSSVRLKRSWGYRRSTKISVFRITWVIFPAIVHAQHMYIRDLRRIHRMLNFKKASAVVTYMYTVLHGSCSTGLLQLSPLIIKE